MRKILRSGYTTGACAAAASKAATRLLLSSASGMNPSAGFIAHQSLPGDDIEIPFPDGSRVSFKISASGLRERDSQLAAWASVIKDAGDDPDVTNGAEIVAEVGIYGSEPGNGDTEGEADCPSLVIRGGKGVGRVTKPGLPMPVGEAAINPVPRKMIKEAVLEALKEAEKESLRGIIELTISVPEGEELAKRTLNSRLGIIGGLSILGTSGIVKPLSAEAWTASITASMDVAKALNLDEIVVSAGRVSEKAHMDRFGFPEEAYVMMGDYLEFSLVDAKKHAFRRVHLCAQWAKMLKIAMSTPQTHVRHGAIDVGKAVRLLNSIGIAVPQDAEFNTAREVFDYIVSAYGLDPLLLGRVCTAAKKYAEVITGGVPVINHLISYEGEVLVSSE